MDSIHVSLIAVVMTIVGVVVSYRLIFGKEKLARGEKPRGSHELEVAIKMGSASEKSEAMREMARLYAQHGDAWTAESYMKLALNVLEEENGTLSPELVPTLKDYAQLLRKFSRIGQADEMDKRIRNVQKQRSD